MWLDCFKWCVKYHQTSKEKNGDTISVIKKMEDKCDYASVNRPATFDDIATFENNNKIGVCVYGIDEENIRTENTGNID